MHVQTFTYPTYLLKLWKFAAGLGFAGFLFFIFSAVSDPPKAPREWILLCALLIFFIAGGFFLTRYAALMNCHIEVSKSHITQVGPGDKLVSLSWDEISKISSRPFLKRLDLVSDTSGQRIHIEEQITGYFHLHTQIVRRVRSEILSGYLQSDNQTICRFHRDKWTHGILIAVMLLFISLAVFALLAGQGTSSLGYAAVSTLFLAASLTEIKAISLHKECLYLEYPLSKPRKISYSDVRDILHRQRLGRYATVHNLIYLALETGKKIQLAGYREGDALLYEELLRKIKQGSKIRRPPVSG